MIRYVESEGIEDRRRGTEEVRRIAEGDREAVERLLPEVYQELRALAGGLMRGAADQTLQPTALVHEVYLKLVDAECVEWRERAHFRALAATAMRQILADHARRRRARPIANRETRVALAADPSRADAPAPRLVELDAALERLAHLDPRQHRVVELRYFGGLSVDEAAEVLGVSVSTVEREWRAARAWIAGTLQEGEA